MVFRDLLAEMWAQMETDPEDFHVAEAAVLCRADALCTANMNMVKDKDWLSLMESLDLAWPPQLCREENIVDCLSGKPELWRNSEWIARAALSVMYPSSRLLQSLQKVGGQHQRGFPTLVRTTRGVVVEALRAGIAAMACASKAAKQQIRLPAGT